MSEMAAISKADLANLEERVKRLASEKSYLQLVIQLMTKMSAVSGLADTIESMLRAIGDVIGGLNIILYYTIDGVTFYADVYGENRRVDSIDDDLVKRVLETHEPIEYEHEYSDTKMMTPEFTKAHTWVVPLLVGSELIGVIKMESLIAMRELSQQLPAFYSFAALLLKNEIQGDTRLKEAYDGLEQEVAVRKRAEEELRSANAALEERVAGRTEELQRANEELRKNDQQIQALLRKSEQSRLALLSLLEDEKLAEEELLRVNRALRMLSDTNQALIRITEEATLLDEVCRIVVETGGYHMAWVGFAEQDEAKTLRPVAHAGLDSGYIESAKVTWADNEQGRGPGGTAVRAGQPCIARRIHVDPSFAPWREAAIQHGYNSIIALPLISEGQTLGALSIYAIEEDAFDSREVDILKEMASDLAFGIATLRTRAERTRAEEALRDSEEKLGEATRIAHVGYWDRDFITESVTLSDEACRIGGLPEHDRFVKLPEWHTLWIKLIHPEDQPRATQALADALAGGPPYNLEYRLVRSDGEVRNIHSYADVTRDESGKPIRMFGTMIDITERKRAEQERLAHLRFLESLDRVNRAIHGTNDMGRMMNDALETVFSIFDCDRTWLFYPCDPDAPSFRVPMEIAKPEYPGAKVLNVDIPMPPDMAQNVRETLESAGPVTYTVGTERPVNKVSAEQFGVQSQMFVALYPKSGKPWAFGLHQCSYPRVWTSEEKRLFQEIGRRLADALTSLLMLRDLRRSEEFLNDIVENIPDMIFVKDAEALRFVRFNQAGEKLLGYSREELAGKSDSDLFPKEEADSFTAKDREVLSQKGVVDIPEETIRTRDGNERIIHTKKIPIVDNDGNPQYLLGISEDITERKRVEMELRQSERRKGILNRIATIFLSASDAQMYGDVLAIVLEITKSPLGLFGYIADNGDLVIPSLTGEIWNECTVSGKSMVFPPSAWGETLWGRALRERKALYSSGNLRTPAGHVTVDHFLTVPIVFGAHSIGLLSVANKGGGYTEGDKGLLESIASYISPILHARLQRDREERVRRQAEQDLRESQESLRAIFESAADGILVADLETQKFTHCNPQICKMTGYSADEILSLTVTDIHPIKDLPYVMDQFSRQAAKEFTLAKDIPVRRRDGSLFFAEVNSAAIALAGKKSMVGFFRDMTERKLAEEELHRLNRLYTVLSRTNEMIIRVQGPQDLFDEACRIAVEHGSFKMAWVGVADEKTHDVKPIASYGDTGCFLESIRISIDDIPEGHGPAGTALREGRHFVCRDIEHEPFMAPWREAAGAMGYRSSAAFPLRTGDAVTGVYAVYSSEVGWFSEGEIRLLDELTADMSYALGSMQKEDLRKQAEKQLHLLGTAIEQASEVIVITDREGTILYANPAFEEISGYSRWEAIGKNPRILKSGCHDAAFYKNLWDTILAGNVWSGQFINKRKNGRLYTEQSVISPVRDPSGAIIAFVAGKRDITKELELQQELNAAKDLETIGMIAGGVAHEVRNPLFAISTVVAALVKKLAGQTEFQEYADHIQDQTRRLNELMSDLLTLGRPLKSEQFQSCRLQDIVRDAIRLMADTVPGADRRCVVISSGGTSAIRAVPEKLTQVIVNLLQNAFAFSPPDATVSVRIEQEAGQVRLHIQDSGSGIPADLLPAIFEPFHSKRKGGTGLGLAIVRQIVTAHGGTVEAANNDPPPGATFTVRLPLAGC